MPSTIPSQPLYRATCIEDLMKKSEVKLDKKNPIHVCKTLSKMLDGAKKSRMNGDDENAYILYMRYLSCIGWLQKTPEVIKDKDFLKPYVSGSKVNLFETLNVGSDDYTGNIRGSATQKNQRVTKMPDVRSKSRSANASDRSRREQSISIVKEILDLLEEMKQKLIHRYEEKKLEENSKLLTKNVQRMEVDSESANLDDLLNDIEDVKLNLPDIPTDEPLIQEPETAYTCMELFQAMKKLNDRIIIIDIRESADFQISHINSEQCVNLPANFIKPGILAREMLKIVMNDEKTRKVLEHRRSQYTDVIVLLDWQTTKASLNQVNCLHILKTTLRDWDPGVSYKKIVILDGGYKEWLTHYPSYTTDPSVTAPDIESTNISEILEKVEYPDLIPSDEEQTIRVQFQPIPARSLKPTIKEKQNTGIKKSNALDDRKNNAAKSVYNINETNIYPNNLSSPWRFDSINNSFTDETVRSNKAAENLNTNNLIHRIDSRERNIVSKLKEVEISKPIIDRSNKPNSIEPCDADSEKIIGLLKQAIDILKSCHQLENDRMMLESQMFDSEDQRDEGSDQNVNTPKRIEVLGAAVAEKMKFYMDIKTKLKEYAQNGINVDPAYEEEETRLRLDIGLAEQKVKSVSIERKIFMEKRHKKLEEIAKMKLKNLSTPPQEPQTDVIKAPLKKDGPSPNSGLKRSYSSPNLKPLEAGHEFGNRGVDNSIPQVDRTSKPSKQQEQNINNLAAINNTTIINRQRLKGDRERRMSPIFGNMHPGITGLKNLGNSCYMNSIIQCLSNTTSLARYFIQGSYIDDLNPSSRKTGGQVVEEVAQVIKALWCGHYRSISPQDLKVVIGQYKKQFGNQEQQDSHEFLTFLLEWMHNDLRTRAKLDLDRTINNAEKEWNKTMQGFTSIISQLFFGQLRSTISCATCGNSSTTYESFNSLTLSLPDSVRCTLDDCIRKYVSGQRVSGWRCPNCNAARDATKKFDFIKLAPIIVVHLNRFGEAGGWIQKANTAVDFPLLSLDLRSYVAHESETTTINNSYHQTYNLYAVSNHYGTMEGGHYTAYCNSASQNKWYKYDDNHVREVSPTDVKSQNVSAYLLFYTSVPNSPYMVM